MAWAYLSRRRPLCLDLKLGRYAIKRLWEPEEDLMRRDAPGHVLDAQLKPGPCRSVRRGGLSSSANDPLVSQAFLG